MNKPAAINRKAAFRRPDLLPASLSASAAADLLAAVGDLAFILSPEGEILDVAVSHVDLAGQDFVADVGAMWADSVTLESRPKISEMLAAAKGGAAGRWRQINHPSADGDVPVRYLVIGLGKGERFVAIGRDMRNAAAIQRRLLMTQQSLERDYLRLREAETRYRVLFDMAVEAVLIVDAETRCIREANPAAHRLLDASDGALIGNPVNSIVAAGQRDDLVAYLGAAEAADEVGNITLQLADERGEATMAARLFRQGRRPLLIVRVEPGVAVPAGGRFDSALGDVVERMPDAFVLVDRSLNVLTANAAFVELTEMRSVERVVGARLGVWLGRPGIDLELIVGQLREHGFVRNVATILRGSAGAQDEIEVSGVVARFDEGECFGFTIRTVGRRLREAPVATADVPRSVGQLTELVGRMSLKDIVRESTDMIERLCIEAALVYTADNRASAAEILGVSRQSLYSKLHRHGIGNLVSGDD